jgi:hypothetical protein
MPFHKALLQGIRNHMAWCRAKKEDVGFGLAGQCPFCSTPGGQIKRGWLNSQGFGNASFECRTCHRWWSWSRKPKAVTV